MRGRRRCRLGGCTLRTRIKEMGYTGVGRERGGRSTVDMSTGEAATPPVTYLRGRGDGEWAVAFVILLFPSVSIQMIPVLYHGVHEYEYIPNTHLPST